MYFISIILISIYIIKLNIKINRLSKLNMFYEATIEHLKSV